MIKLRLLMLTAILLSFVPAGTVFAAGSEADIAFNNHLETRIKTVVTEITGIEKVIVVVNADIDIKSKDRMAGFRNKPVTAKMDRKEKSEESAEVLPGVPAKKEFGKEVTTQVDYSDNRAPIIPEFITSGAMIQRIAVSILIDKTATSQQINSIKEIVASIIGFNPSRGDILEVKTVDFKKKDSKFLEFFTTPHFYWFMLTVLGLAFIVLTGLFFMSLLRHVSSTLTHVNLSVSRPGAGSGGIIQVGGGSDYAADNPSVQLSGEQEKLLPGGAGNTGSSEPQKKLLALPPPQGPFSFIEEKHLRDIAFIVSDNNAEDMAIIINYLSQDLASKFLDILPPDKQAEVAVALTGLREINPDKVKLLEENIKNRLSYIVRGEDKAASILGLANDEVREKVLAMMDKKDRMAADRMKEKVRSFEELMMEIPVEIIQDIYRNLDVALFAQVLKSSPEDIQKRVLESLTTGAAERLAQEIELSSPLPPARLRKEKLNVLSAIRRIQEMGSGMEE